MTPDRLELLLDIASVPQERRTEALRALQARLMPAHSGTDKSPARSLYDAGGQEGSPKDHNAQLKRIEAAAQKLIERLDELRQGSGYPWSRFWCYDGFGPVDSLVERPEVFASIFTIREAASAAMISRLGRTPEIGKLNVIRLALTFFRAFSPHDPSTHRENPFREFSHEFYELAVGPISPDEDDFLSRAIAAALNETR